MTVQPTQQSPTSAAAAAAPAAPANPYGDMSGKDTFMKLLVAELKNQDPNQPMDARDMVAQLAQLTSVEKLSGIDTTLTSMQAENASASALQGAGLIGRSVTANTNHLDLGQLGTPQGSYQLQGKAADVSVNVRDASGQVVARLALGAQGAGGHAFQWDGQTAAGTRAPNGSYTFDVTASDDKGVPVVSSTEVSGLVTEITYESGAPEIVVAGAHVPLGDVTSIAQ